MKKRIGFVSNSSSASFAIPSSLLTDEQIEILLSVDNGVMDEINEILGKKTIKNIGASYPRNEEYHKIFKTMVENGQWYDDWTIQVDQKRNLITASTSCDNGSLETLMERVGIDLSMIEFSGDHEFKKATHPEAIKHFHYLYERWWKMNQDEYNALTDEDEKQLWVEAGWIDMKKNNPYDKENEKC